jgi:hypothetical protein
MKELCLTNLNTLKIGFEKWKCYSVVVICCVDPLWSTDPDPAFYLIADPDSGSQTNADPGGPRSWSDFFT